MDVVSRLYGQVRFPNGRYYLGLACLVSLGAALAACGGDARPTMSPTPTASPSVAPSATPSPGPVTPSPTATEDTGEALYRRGTRTGLAGVDAFIAAMENSDGAALLALRRYTPVPCASAGYPHPVCPAGVADGTPVDTLYNGRCDGSWYFEAFQSRQFVTGEFAAFAVARLPTPARPIAEGRYPAADYLVVMEDRRGPTGEPRAAFIAGDGVVALFTGCCCISPRKLLDDNLSVYSGGTAGGTFLLPPK